MRQSLFFSRRAIDPGEYCCLGLDMLVFPLCKCYMYCIVLYVLFGIGLAKRLRVETCKREVRGSMCYVLCVERFYLSF